MSILIIQKIVLFYLLTLEFLNDTIYFVSCTPTFDLSLSLFHSVYLSVSKLSLSLTHSLYSPLSQLTLP